MTPDSREARDPLPLPPFPLLLPLATKPPRQSFVVEESSSVRTVDFAIASESFDEKRQCIKKTIISLNSWKADAKVERRHFLEIDEDANLNFVEFASTEVISSG